MHAIASLVTAAALFLHTVLGCCWHHAQCRAESAAVTAAAATHSKCCHHEHSDEGHTPAKPGKCKVECGGSCTYLLPQKTQIEGSQLVLPLHLEATQATTVANKTVLAIGNPFFCIAERMPPLRLHLLHQILLI